LKFQAIAEKIAKNILGDTFLPHHVCIFYFSQHYPHDRQKNKLTDGQTEEAEHRLTTTRNNLIKIYIWATLCIKYIQGGQKNVTTK